MLSFEDIYKQNIGIDEVGRGSWSGPVIACALILKRSILKESMIEQINDSKKISKIKRDILSKIIKRHSIYNFGVSHVEEIDEVNILNSTKLAMLRAYKKFSKKKNLVNIDGQQIFEMGTRFNFIIKGDQKSLAIASASILAKVHRDQIMTLLSKLYPVYNWRRNMGYGTREHFNAIKTNGISPFHRKSFAPIKKFLQSKQILVK